MDLSAVGLRRGGRLDGGIFAGDLALRVDGAALPPLETARADGATTTIGPFPLGRVRVTRRITRTEWGLRYLEVFDVLATDAVWPAEVRVEGTSLGRLEATSGASALRWVVADGVGFIFGAPPIEARFRAAFPDRGVREGGRRFFRYGWDVALPTSGSIAVVHGVVLAQPVAERTASAVDHLLDGLSDGDRRLLGA